MRLLISCTECFKELGRPSNEFHLVEFRDDSRYEIKCSHGHETTAILQEQKFEILFDIGAHAILDGYYREAVSSFTSSLERFYEFSLRVFLEKKFNADELFQKCWKKVANQSERQLGAFYFLWAVNFGNPPELLSNKQIEFRNAVIHKGKIPTREEAIEYGDSVLDLLAPQIGTLREHFDEEVSKVTFYHLRNARSESDRKKYVSTIVNPTVVSLIGSPESSCQQLTEYLVLLAQKRKLLGLFSGQ